jgi:hypothetical protein
MATQQPKPPADKPGGALWSRMVAGAAGAALGAFIADFAIKSPGATWTGAWFGPLCAGLGAIAGMAIDYYVLSGKDDGKPS